MQIERQLKAFINKTTNVLNAQPNLVEDVKNGLRHYCDGGFDNEDEILAYCKEQHIPC